MPTYEYKCVACGHRFERFQSMKADPLTECEECGGKVKRLISAGGGLIFKGSGFYATDHRSDSYKQQAKTDSDASSPSKATKTDSDGSSPSTATKTDSDGSSSSKDKPKSD